MATTTTKQSNSGVLETPPLEEAPANLPAPRARSNGVQAIVPQSWQEITAIAGAICRAKMAPKSYCNDAGEPYPDKVAVAIMHGMEVGMTPMASLQSIAVINGMPGLYGDGMLAVVRASGLLEDIVEELEWDAQQCLKATCRVKRKGEPQWGVTEIYRADCGKAGWLDKKGPWQLTPHRMMQMRARGWALRDKFADVLRGLHSAEEAEDMLDVTPQGSARVAENAPPEPTRDPPKKESAATTPADSGQAASSPPTAAGANGKSEGAGQPAQDQVKEPAGAGAAGAEQSEKTAETETSAAGARDAKPAEIKPRTGKRKAKDAAKVTDVKDQNEVAGADVARNENDQADIKSAQAREAAEPITFEPYNRPGDFFTFSDGWIQDKSRTVDELEQWHAFYAEYMQKLKSQGSKGTQDATDDTLMIYGRVMAKLLNKDA